MLYALNYSNAAAELLRAGEIAFDRFKCPAWPDTIAEARARHPVYVHCPLRAGMGIGDALDTETGQPADWDRYAALLAQADTPWVSVHMTVRTSDHPDLPPTSLAPHAVEQVTAALIRDVGGVVARMGPERVVIENIFSFYGRHLWAAALPEVAWRVVEATGCGLLLDLSHARLAARELGRDPRTYIAALPVAHLREVHVTGLQRFAGPWVDRAREAGLENAEFQDFAGRLIDHLPMTEDDWPIFAWAMDQIHRGAWRTPWVVAFEYGGIGGVYEAVTDPAVLTAQVPRMRALVKGAA